MTNSGAIPAELPDSRQNMWGTVKYWLHCIQVGSQKWDHGQLQLRGGAAQGSGSLSGEPKREQWRGLSNATTPTSSRTFKGCPSTYTVCDSTKNATTSTSGSDPKVETQVHGPYVNDARSEQLKGAGDSSTGPGDIDGMACAVEVNTTAGATASAEYLNSLACTIRASEEAHGH